MHTLYFDISETLSGDHHYMTLAACRALPDAMQELMLEEAGLLIRYFCELPDLGWPIFGTLGDWEINNHFSYDIRRNLNAPFYLEWNPVMRTGERFGHDSAGSRPAVKILLAKAIDAISDSRLRDALAYCGAACHHLQDAVTFPEQQTLHRRSMSDVLTFEISGYCPEVIFSAVEDVPGLVDDLLDRRIAPELKLLSRELRRAMISGDARLRHQIQMRSDMLGAQITADILLSLLSLYTPAAPVPVNYLETFNDLDEEFLPAGYFVDREDNQFFQGYAGVEGAYPRGFELRLTSGHQLRLSATADSEVKWKMGIVHAVPLDRLKQYRFKAAAYLLNATGDNGIRLLIYDYCWNIENSIEIPFELVNDWQKIDLGFTTNANNVAMTIEFYSRNNTGTVLLDNWQIYDSGTIPLEAEQLVKSKLKLALAPGENCYLRDKSNFAVQNEPITCVRDNSPANITEGEDFVFDGSSFIEIPYHPLYTPLQVQGVLNISLDLYPEYLAEGEIIIAANLYQKPVYGWRIFLQNGKICVAVYADGREYIHVCRGAEIKSEKWYNINFQLSPANEITVNVDGKISTGKADFSRCYSQSAIFIGADSGACNFFTGRVKNLRITEK